MFATDSRFFCCTNIRRLKGNTGAIKKLNPELKEIEAGDHRYTRFKPFQSKAIFTYDARKGAKGGSEYLELGYLRPDIILTDLVKIAHPELLPDYQLYFHQRLE